MTVCNAYWHGASTLCLSKRPKSVMRHNTCTSAEPVGVWGVCTCPTPPVDVYCLLFSGGAMARKNRSRKNTLFWGEAEFCGILIAKGDQGPWSTDRLRRKKRERKSKREGLHYFSLVPMYGPENMWVLQPVCLHNGLKERIREKKKLLSKTREKEKRERGSVWICARCFLRFLLCSSSAAWTDINEAVRMWCILSSPNDRRLPYHCNVH